MKKITIILGLIITFSTVIGIGWKLDVRWSQAVAVESLQKQVILLSDRFEFKNSKDRLEAIEERMWKLEEVYGENISTFPPLVKEEYKKLKLEAELVKKELDLYNTKKEK
jgi:translation initiation factor 2 alpha subunit (eIF-2alpha)